jgi:hypothetical protein
LRYHWNMQSINLLDTLALTEDLPERGLYKGQVGTVVELLPPDGYEVEFVDGEERTYVTVGLRADTLLVLRYEPVEAA